MNLCLHPPCIDGAFSCSAASRRRRHEKHDPLYSNKKPTNSPFPKSYPTPLLLPSHRSEPQSQIQALETVLANLESSVNRGIQVNDPQIFASLLETCFQLGAIDHGIKIHSLIPDNLLRKNAGISSKLLRLYAHNGQLDKAHELFDVMPDRSSFVWNSLISGYANAGSHEDALSLYLQMVEEGVDPSQHTFPRVLKACGGVGMIQVGEEIHRHVIRYGFGNNTFILNALVDMYSKCGNIARARRVFDFIQSKDLVSWNTMINGYVKHGLTVKALFILRWMVREECEPDPVTLSAILTSTCPCKAGSQIHGWALRRGVEWDLSVANSLIIFYSNQSDLRRASWVFENMPERDVVSWNSIISAHSKGPLALEYFNRLTESDTVSPDSITFVSSLSACARLGMVEEGERIFSMIAGKYEMSPSMEHCACMVNLYGRAGLVEEAYGFIDDRMGSEAGPTVWGALLYACYLHGNVEVGEIAAENLFELEPDGEHNFELLIKIYRRAGRYEDAERVKSMMMERGLEM